MPWDTKNKKANPTSSFYQRELTEKEERGEQDRISDMKMVDRNQLFTFSFTTIIMKYEIALQKNKGQNKPDMDPVTDGTSW